MTLLQDENGHVSTARAAFWVWLVFVMIMISLDVLSTEIVLDGHVYSAFVAVFLALAGWAGGPRIMQHLAPQISKAARAINVDNRRPTTDELRKLQDRIAESQDDERGDHTKREPVQWP